MFNKVRNFFADKAQNDPQPHNEQGESLAANSPINNNLPLIANPGLINAIHALQTEETASHRIRFQELIKSARLFITITALDKLADDTRIVHHQSSPPSEPAIGIGIAQYKKNNKFYYYVFTDLESLEKWHQQSSLKDTNSEANIVTFNDLCGLILGEGFDPSGIIINAGQEEFLVEYDFFKQESSKKADYQEQLGTNAVLQPLDFSGIPAEFASALTSAFEKTTDIHAAWMTIMKMNHQRYLALIIDFNGNEEDIFPRLVDICNEYLDESEKLLILSANNEPFNNIVEQLPPVFVRAN